MAGRLAGGTSRTDRVPHAEFEPKTILEPAREARPPLAGRHAGPYAATLALKSLGVYDAPALFSKRLSRRPYR